MLVLIPPVSCYVTLYLLRFQSLLLLGYCEEFREDLVFFLFGVDHVVTMYRHVQNKTFHALSSQSRSALLRKASSAAAAVTKKPLTSILIANRGEIAL